MVVTCLLLLLVTSGEGHFCKMLNYIEKQKKINQHGIPTSVNIYTVDNTIKNVIFVVISLKYVITATFFAEAHDNCYIFILYTPGKLYIITTN